MTQIIKLFQSFIWSYFGLVNVLFLYLLAIFLFSLLGCFIYKDVQYKDYTDHFSTVTRFFNFDDFYRGFSLIFLSSYDSFEVFMLEYMYAVNTKMNHFVTVVFFICYFFFCFVIMLNLFLLIIIMQYDEFYQKKENPIDKFENIFKIFNRYWAEFVEEGGSAMMIKSSKLKKLLEMLENEENLGGEQLKVCSTKIFIFDLKLFV